jgi:hydroxymethylpyrimidine pyrophosphatase-like HAD family hydrolase
VQPLIKRELAGRAIVFTSKPYFLEIMPLHSGKGVALGVLAEKLGIPVEQTMAFGDSMNDESMILSAGIGVAMKNGLPGIRASAQYVTERTNDEDGAAFFLEQHCL